MEILRLTGGNENNNNIMNLYHRLDFILAPTGGIEVTEMKSAAPEMEEKN